MKHYLRVRRVVVPLLLVLLAYFSAFRTLDSQANVALEKSMQRSLIAFATARGLNGLISVAQGTELAFHPTGLGASFAPGEILDPVNDLIESLSWVLFASASALAFQKLLLALSSSPFFIYSVSAFLVFSACLSLRARHTEPLCKPLLLRLLLLTLLFRFAVPAVTIFSENLFDSLLRSPHGDAMAQMSTTKKELLDIKRENGERESSEGIISKFMVVFERAFENAKEAVDISARIDKYREAADQLSRASIDLAVIFFFQTIFIPFSFFILAKYALLLLISPGSRRGP